MNYNQKPSFHYRASERSEGEKENEILFRLWKRRLRRGRSLLRLPSFCEAKASRRTSVLLRSSLQLEQLKKRTKFSSPYVIGVDGGGTKTVAALANLKGKILKIGKAGPASPTNVGIKMVAKSLSQAIEKILPREGKILSTFIGLPAVQERPRLLEKIKKELLKRREISPIFQGKLKIDSDQIVAFRSGSDEKDGVLIIAGTGCVFHGWAKGKEAHASGWGWLADEGSAFWVGQRVYQSIFKDLDGRGPKTLLTKLVFQKLKIKNKENLINLVYLKNPTQIIPQFSTFCDEAARRGDRIAKKIMREAGEELALTTKTIIRKLNFQRKIFPLVLVGSTLQSKIVLDTVKKEVKKFAPKAKIIRPKQEPVIGAIKLAIEQYNM